MLLVFCSGIFFSIFPQVANKKSTGILTWIFVYGVFDPPFSGSSASRDFRAVTVFTKFTNSWWHGFLFSQIWMKVDQIYTYIYRSWFDRLFNWFFSWPLKMLGDDTLFKNHFANFRYIPWAQNTYILEVSMVNNLVFRWPKPLFFMVLGAHGTCETICVYRLHSERFDHPLGIFRWSNVLQSGSKRWG